MANCEKCGVAIPEGDAYEVNGKTYCEDCAVKVQNSPSRQCTK